MQYLNPNQYKWLKISHLLFVSFWLGSAIALVAGQVWLKLMPNLSPYWVLNTLNFIDWYILVPGASGVVVTGVLFSLKTKWGWGKSYFWIRAKWFIALLGVIVGTFFLAPWLHTLIQQAKTMELGVYQDSSFVSLWNWLLFWGVIQVISLVYALYLSVFKPKAFLVRK
jgi:hypothetical protein